MPDQVERARPPLSAWRAESLRLTAFPASLARPRQMEEWPGWQAAFSSPPPNRASREHGQEIREDGAFAGSWLSFIGQPARLDWVFHPKMESLPSPDSTLRVGGFVEAIPLLEAPM